MTTKKQEEGMIGQIVTRPENWGFGEKPLIFDRMAKVMAGITAIAKKKQQGAGVSYAFRSIEDVMNAVYPTLVEHGVFIVPQLIDVKNELYVQPTKDGKSTRNLFHAVLKMGYRFYTIDGSYVDGWVAAESSDYSDKATQQAGSYCFKEIILKTFCVPTENVQDDGDGKKPDETGVVQSKKKSENLEGLPKLSDRPSVEDIKSAAAEENTVEMTPEFKKAWNKIKEELSIFELTDHAMHTWAIKTLRAGEKDVPNNLRNLEKPELTFLWKVAHQSQQLQELQYEYIQG